MFEPFKKSPDRLRAVDRLTAWTRARFGLPGETAISVSELACALPGCAPRETVVMFWIARQRYQFKVFKPLGEVVVDDLPYAWLKDALAVSGESGCGCC